MLTLNHTDTPAVTEYATVYVAFELSKAKWRLGVVLPGSQKLSRFTIDGGDLAALSGHLAKWRGKAAANSKLVRIISCYEAGYDGPAPVADRSRCDQLRNGSGEHSGEPSRAPAENGSARS